MAFDGPLIAGRYRIRETLGNGTEIRHSMDGNITLFPNVPGDLVQPSGYVDNRSTSKTVTDKQDRFYVNTTGIGVVLASISP